MRINRNRCKVLGRALNGVQSGVPITFCKSFHQDHCVEDLFIVVNHNGYMDVDGRRSNHNKSVVVNMRSGKMSVVDGNRDCRMIKGEFVVEGECG